MWSQYVGLVIFDVILIFQPLKLVLIIDFVITFVMTGLSLISPRTLLTSVRMSIFLLLSSKQIKTR